LLSVLRKQESSMHLAEHSPLQKGEIGVFHGMLASDDDSRLKGYTDFTIASVICSLAAVVNPQFLSNWLP